VRCVAESDRIDAERREHQCVPVLATVCGPVDLLDRSSNGHEAAPLAEELNCKGTEAKTKAALT
jgi:hypothetical protein